MGNTIVVTLCHVCRFLRKKDPLNPFQPVLDADLNLLFLAATPRLSRMIFAVGYYLESLRRAYLFRNSLKSLNLILVTGIFYFVGDWFTIPRLVVSLNLFFFISQLKTSHLLRCSTFLSNVLRRFF